MARHPPDVYFMEDLRDDVVVYVSLVPLLGLSIAVRATHGQVKDGIEAMLSTTPEVAHRIAKATWDQLNTFSVATNSTRVQEGDVAAAREWCTFCSNAIALCAFNYVVHGLPFPIMRCIPSCSTPIHAEEVLAAAKATTVAAPPIGIQPLATVGSQAPQPPEERNARLFTLQAAGIGSTQAARLSDGRHPQLGPALSELPAAASGPWHPAAGGQGPPAHLKAQAAAREGLARQASRGTPADQPASNAPLAPPPGAAIGEPWPPADGGRGPPPQPAALEGMGGFIRRQASGSAPAAQPAGHPLIAALHAAARQGAQPLAPAGERGPQQLPLLPVQRRLGSLTWQAGAGEGSQQQQLPGGLQIGRQPSGAPARSPPPANNDQDLLAALQVDIDALLASPQAASGASRRTSGGSSGDAQPLLDAPAGGAASDLKQAFRVPELVFTSMPVAYKPLAPLAPRAAAKKRADASAGAGSSGMGRGNTDQGPPPTGGGATANDVPLMLDQGGWLPVEKALTDWAVGAAAASNEVGAPTAPAAAAGGLAGGAAAAGPAAEVTGVQGGEGAIGRLSKSQKKRRQKAAAAAAKKDVALVLADD